MIDQFAMKLAREIEQLAIDKGMNLRECIEAGIDLLRMQQMKNPIKKVGGGNGYFGENQRS